MIIKPPKPGLGFGIWGFGILGFGFAWLGCGNYTGPRGLVSRNFIYPCPKYPTNGKNVEMNALYIIQRLKELLEMPKTEQKRNMEMMRFGK